MWKVICSLFLFIFLFWSTSAYTATQNDKDTVDVLTSKINKIIEKKWEKLRTIFIKKLSTLKHKIKKNEKITYIIWELVNNLNNSTQAIEDLIKEVENHSNNTNKNSDKLSSLLLLQEYGSMYNKLIDNDIYWKNWKFDLGCWNYAIKWNEIYKDQFQNIYNKSNLINNIFLMDLMKYDIEKFNKYFKKTCKNDAKIDSMLFTTTSISRNLDSFDNSYYTEIYIFYNNWYNTLYKYLKDSKPWETCNTVWEDWDGFTYDKMEYLKTYTKNTNSDIYLKYFSELQDKFRKMMKEECNGLKIK